MDDLIPIAIFVIVMLFSVIANITKRLRKTEEDGSAPRKSPPEVLRRLLTETEEIPVARPKGVPPSVPQYRVEPPPLARPLDQPRMQGPEPLQMTPEVVIQPAASPAPTLRDRAEGIRRQLEQAFQAAVEQVAPAEPARVQARPQRLPEGKRPVQPPMMQQRRQPAARPRGEQAPAGRSRVQELFPGMDAVRRGIIMAEVLGPPKAMQ